MNKVEVSLVLACYNEGPTFEKSIGKILKELRNLPYKWEVIFVEDKSKDDTKKNLIRISKKIRNAKVIFHESNKGRGKTVTDGILAANGDICGFMDVDCEISPKYIGKFVKSIESGYEMAIAKRAYKFNAKSVNRVIASKAYSFLTNQFLGLPLHDTEAGFKFFNRGKILPVIKRTRDTGWFWDTEICARSYAASLRILEIPVLFIRREEKKSTVRIFHDSIDYAKKLWVFKKEFRAPVKDVEGK